MTTFVQLYGTMGFELLKAIHKNVAQYTRSGGDPSLLAGRGEVAIGVSFANDVVERIRKGFPIRFVAPKDGIGYEIGALALVKGAPNRENGLRLIDWALDPQNQVLGPQNGEVSIQSNSRTPIDPDVPKFEDVKLIAYDFGKYGTPAVRDGLIKRRGGKQAFHAALTAGVVARRAHLGATGPRVGSVPARGSAQTGPPSRDLARDARGSGRRARPARGGGARGRGGSPWWGGRSPGPRLAVRGRCCWHLPVSCEARGPGVGGARDGRLSTAGPDRARPLVRGEAVGGASLVAPVFLFIVTGGRDAPRERDVEGGLTASYLLKPRPRCFSC